MEITYTFKNGNGDTQEVTEEISLNLWEKYGKRRVYINDSNGKAIGYYDADTEEIVSVQTPYFYRNANFAAHVIEQAGIMNEILKVAGIEVVEEEVEETPVPTAEEIAAEVAEMDEIEVQEAANAEFEKIQGWKPEAEEKFQRYNYSDLAPLDWYAHLCGRSRAGKLEHGPAVKSLREDKVVEMPHQCAWELAIAQMRIEAGTR
jgi:hypothetical protein